MGFVIVSYDLHGVEKDKSAYDRLHERLSKKEFERASVESTWTKDYAPLSRVQAATQAQRQFTEAAKEAKIAEYTFVVYSSEEWIEVDVKHVAAPKVKPK